MSQAVRPPSGGVTFAALRSSVAFSERSLRLLEMVVLVWKEVASECGADMLGMAELVGGGRVRKSKSRQHARGGEGKARAGCGRRESI